MRWMRSWGIVAVFVIADVLVLGLAWRQTHQPTPADAASVSTPGDGTGSTDASGATIRGPLFLATSASGAVLRVTRGSCDSREPERARVWAAGADARLASTTVAGLQEALGVLASDTALRIVGADSDCAIHGWVSTDAGATWKQTAVPSRMWYLDTDTTENAVHGPVTGGVQNLDCAPVSVATLPGGSQALVSCSGSNVLTVSDDPTTASVSYAVSSPVAATQPGSGLPLVLAESESCAAELAQVTSQQAAAQVACLSQTAAPLGLAASGQRIVAQVGQRLLLSDDGGRRFAAFPEGS